MILLFSVYSFRGYEPTGWEDLQVQRGILFWNVQMPGLSCHEETVRNSPNAAENVWVYDLEEGNLPSRDFEVFLIPG